MKLFPAVAPHGTKHITGKTFRMNTHQDRLGKIDFPPNQGDMQQFVHIILIDSGLKITCDTGRNDCGGNRMYEALGLKSVFDQVCDGTDSDIMLF